MNSVQANHQNLSDLYLAVLAPNGAGASDLVYATYLGGDEDDGPRGIGLDSQGRVCIAACTNSDVLLPITVTGAGSVNTGLDDAYVCVLDPTPASGAPVVSFASYIGGSGLDDPTDLVVDVTDRLVVCGITHSHSSTSPPLIGFPTTAGAFDSTGDAAGDAFVARVDPTSTSGGHLVMSTLLGGAFGGDQRDVAKGLRVESNGTIFVAGETTSMAFPTSAGALDSNLGGAVDAFVAQFNAGGTTLLFSTYFGGSGDESVWGVAYTDRPTFTIAGATTTASTSATQDLFVTGPFTANSGGRDGFITKFSF